MNKDYAVFDLETTGGSPKQEKIIEIAILKFDGEKIIDQFQSLVNPEKNIPPYVSKLTGISSEMVSNAPIFAELADAIKEFLKNCILVAHNAKGDYAFLKKEYKEIGTYFEIEHICTIKLTKLLFPELEKVNLPFLTNHFTIEHDNAHRALSDAQATTKLFKKYLDWADKKDLEKIIDFTKNSTLENLKIDKAEIKNIPEETGVLLFKNDLGKIIYVAKSININGLMEEMVFNFNRKSHKSVILSKTKNTEFIVTGSELLATLLEINLIFKYKPTYNKKIFRLSTITKIELEKNSDGYLELNIKPSKHTEDYYYKFGNKYSAIKTVEKLIQKYKLCNNLSSLKTKVKDGKCAYLDNKFCNGACLKKEDKTKYNKRVTRALQSLDMPQNFTIIDEGPEIKTQSIIKVKNNNCEGFAFTNKGKQNLNELAFKNEFVRHPAIINTIKKFVVNKKVKKFVQD